MNTRGPLYWQLMVVCLSLVSAFDIFDKKTNLLSYVRGTGSLDPEEDTVRYDYGTIFARFPGESMQKLFYSEGYNVRRLVRTSTGFNLMSCEIIVYRDIVTYEILRIWMNPFKKIPNEVFTVQNNPIDQSMSFENMQATVLYPQGNVRFSSKIFAQRKNILDPKIYPQYSSGLTYMTADLYHTYMNLTELATSVSPSVNSVVTRLRRAPFLPWMEMGNTTGSLFYHKTLWKLNSGFDDVAPDILALVKKSYPEFLKAPTKYTGEWETSWAVFKKVIDKRRSQGKPDIILPLVSVLNNATTKHQKLDQKIVKAAFGMGEMKVFLNGTVHSEIFGEKSIHLFNFEGLARLSLLDYSSDSLLVDIYITGTYHDPVTGSLLNYFKNPFKGETQQVRPLYFKAVQEVPMSSAYSFPLKSQDKTSVFYDQSDSKIRPDTGIEEWVVNMVSVYMDDVEIDKKSPFFYGTWAKFSSWLPWFNMEKYPGHMVWISDLYKVDSVPPV